MEKVWNWHLGQNEVAPQGTAGGGPPAKIPDEWWEKIVKGVPAEVVGGYAALISFLKIPGDAFPLLVGFVLGLLATFFSMTILRGLKWNNAKPTLRRIARIQIVVALVAFTVWAYAQGGFFAAWMPTFGTGPDARIYHLYEDWAAGALVVVMGGILIFTNKLTGESA
jgi:hypothetical protein